MATSLRYSVVIVILAFASNTLIAQHSNSIGLDLGGYMIRTPKSQKAGDTYNPYIEGSSSLVGLTYERKLTNSLSLGGGGYLNKQFNSIVSVHLPLEVNGKLIGVTNESLFYAGYTCGISLNFNRLVVTGFEFPAPNTSADVEIKKDFYVTPHAGLHAGVKMGRFDFRVQGLFHFLIPEFADFTTTYNDVSESNTNGSIGLSLRIGGAYCF
jgi:hypothetical protein